MIVKMTTSTSFAMVYVGNSKLAGTVRSFKPFDQLSLCISTREIAWNLRLHNSSLQNLLRMLLENGVSVVFSYYYLKLKWAIFGVAQY